MTQESPKPNKANPKVRDDDKRGGGAKGFAGNPPFVATDQQRKEVRELASILSATQIAVKLGLSRSTIERHFAPELQQGLVNVVGLVASKVLAQALDGDKASQFFFLKARGGYTQRHEVTGKGGGPIETRNFDTGGMSLEQKKLLHSTLGGLLEAPANDQNAA